MNEWRSIGTDGWYRIVSEVEKQLRWMVSFAKPTDGIVVASEMDSQGIRHPIQWRNPAVTPLVTAEPPQKEG